MSKNHARGVPTFGSVRFPLLVVALIGMIMAVLAGCGGGGETTNPPDDTAPTITTQPTSRSVEVGANTTFSVVADGDSLTYQWYKLNASSVGVAISGATSSSYTVTSAETGDAGTYYVIVTNSAGSVTSNQVTLTVTDSSGGDSGGVDVVVD